MTTTTQTNGIDVSALQGAIDHVAANPAAGQTRWSVRSEWKGGTRTDHHIESLEFGGEHVERGFKLSIDEPLQLCGTNEYANPQEYLLSAVNACMMVGYSAVAALMGIELSRLEVELEGDIDLRGFFGIDASIAKGYQGLRQQVRIAGSGTPEEMRKLHETVLATSPNFFNITQAIPVNSTLAVE